LARKWLSAMSLAQLVVSFAMSMSNVSLSTAV
jgi:hypothetical protein